jgi:hypothetical protein
MLTWLMADTLLLILFYFILFYFILFYFILFYFILFYFILLKDPTKAGFIYNTLIIIYLSKKKMD